MKKFLLSTVALVGFAGVASAADLPRQLPPPPPPIVPLFTWSGFYFGVNAGAAFSTNDNNNVLFEGGANNIRINQGSIQGSQRSAGSLNLGSGVAGAANQGDDVGFTGGGQIGWNYQFTPGSGFVVGVEADIQYIDIQGGSSGGDRRVFRNFSFTPDNPNFGPAGPNTWGAAFDPRFQQPGGRGAALRVVRGQGLQATDLNYFGTVRGRLGYAFDRTLIYATGGFAYAGGDSVRNTDLDQGFFDDTALDDNRTLFGWTVGGGVEFAFTNLQLFGSSTATFKIEGLYVQLEEDNNNAAVLRPTYSRITRTLRLPAVAGGGNNEDTTEFAVVRAGVNWKF
jgi:outer membrane immunogenic protein